LLFIDVNIYSPYFLNSFLIKAINTINQNFLGGLAVDGGTGNSSGRGTITTWLDGIFCVGGSTGATTGGVGSIGGVIGSGTTTGGSTGGTIGAGSGVGGVGTSTENRGRITPRRPHCCPQVR